mgnify:CR=1 FL=1
MIDPLDQIISQSIIEIPSDPSMPNINDVSGNEGFQDGETDKFESPIKKYEHLSNINNTVKVNNRI